jgi:ketosteroid isomerase-like protein
MNTEICNTTNQPGEADPALAAAKFAERLLSGDSERLVEDFYTEGARLVPPGNHPIVGRDPICRHWTGIAKAGLKAADIRISSVERAGNEAIGLGRYALTFESDGRLESGAFFVRYRHGRDGSWKAVEHVFHSNTAA